MIEQWWADGERVRLELGGACREDFVRRLGSGPPVTLLHGFPRSSHDWAKVAPASAAQHALLLPDFLGFGASDKPGDHGYSIHEQTDLVETMWAVEGITSTRLVAHDHGVSVAQEFLARRAEGDSGPLPELSCRAPSSSPIHDVEPMGAWPPRCDDWPLSDPRRATRRTIRAKPGWSAFAGGGRCLH